MIHGYTEIVFVNLKNQSKSIYNTLLDDVELAKISLEIIPMSGFRCRTARKKTPAIQCRPKSLYFYIL